MTLVAFLDCVLVSRSVSVLQELVYLSHVKYFSGVYSALSPVGAVLRFFLSKSMVYLFTAPHYTDQGGFKRLVLLPQPSECWEYSHEPPHSARRETLRVEVEHKQVKIWVSQTLVLQTRPRSIVSPKICRFKS